MPLKYLLFAAVVSVACTCSAQAASSAVTGYRAIASALFTAWMDAYSQAQKEPSLNNATDAQPTQ